MSRPELTHDVRITDTTLRDGSHAMAHQFTEEQVRDTVRALDRAGVEVIEVTHGDGLGGSSFNYGFSAHRRDAADRGRASRRRSRRRSPCCCVPGHRHGRGPAAGPRRGRGHGRAVATHCTEADVSPQHFAAARDLGMETVGFLMMAHRTSPEELAKQARIMVDAGCQCAVRHRLGGRAAHGRRPRAVRGARRGGRRRGAGRLPRPPEPVASAWPTRCSRTRSASARSTARCARSARARATRPPRCSPPCSTGSACDTGVDVDGPARRGRGRRPPVPQPAGRRWTATRSCRAGPGVYSSFLLHAERAAERYGVPAHEILRRCGELGYVGGQEDMIIDVAIQLAAERASEEA